MSAVQRREEILAAATQVFAKHGFHQTAIEEVARAAGVSKALIYEHFVSKSELQETVLRQITTVLLEEIGTAVAAASTEHDTDSLARLRAGLDAYFTYIERNRDAWHMMFRESVGRDASQVILSMEPTFVSGIAAVLSAAPETAPLLGDVESGVRLRVGAQMLTGSMQWLGNWWVDNMDLVPRATIVDWALDAMWLGLDGWTAKLRSERGVASDQS
jgi:AcrR family transcriptional regulator